MRRPSLIPAIGILAGAVIGACTVAERPAAAQGTKTPAAQVHAGWYLVHEGKGQFQPCGQSAPLQVSAAADLPQRAQAFGLTEYTPVYVRLRGTVRGTTIDVETVEQFGSPTPVRNCGLNGVVLPKPPG